MKSLASLNHRPSSNWRKLQWHLILVTGNIKRKSHKKVSPQPIRSARLICRNQNLPLPAAPCLPTTIITTPVASPTQTIISNPSPPTQNLQLRRSHHVLHLPRLTYLTSWEKTASLSQRNNNAASIITFASSVVKGVIGLASIVLQDLPHPRQRLPRLRPLWVLFLLKVQKNRAQFTVPCIGWGLHCAQLCIRGQAQHIHSFWYLFSYCTTYFIILSKLCFCPGWFRFYSLFYRLYFCFRT